MVHAVRRLALRKAVPVSRAEEALEDFANLRVRRYAHIALLHRVWELRSTMTAFDAAYVALAEALNAPLITADAALSRASGHAARIELFA